MTYDDRGRQLLHVSFEGVVTENVYDAYGRLSEMRYYQSEADFDAAAVSETREFFYDEYGRNVGNRLLNASGNPTRVEATVFDDRGRVLFEESPEGNLRYGYDWLGRMSYTAVFDSGLSFQLADVTSAERITHYDYDILGRLVSVQEDATPADDSDNPQTDTTYGFDLLGRQRAQLTIAPGDPAMNGILTEYVFDDLGRLDLMINTDSSGNVTASYDYKVRADGKRTALEETFWIDANNDGVQDAGELKTTTYDWEYDAAGRLVDEAIDHWDDDFDLAEHFTYDLTGNRVGLDRDQGNDSVLDEAITYQFDANDRLVEEILDDLTATNADTTTTYDYDHTQQTEKVVTETGSGWAISRQQFAYNLQGRIASAISEGYDSGTLASRERTSYTYNSQSYRVTLSTETGTTLSSDLVAESWQLKRETSFLADVHNHTGYVQTIRETTVENGNTLVTDYTFGHDEIAQTKHGVDAQGNAVDETRVFGHDGHGSVRVLYDLAETATSIIEQIASYAAYGSVIAIHSGAGAVVGTDEASFASNLGYSGEQWDGSLQLQNLRARSYDPLTGRFIGLDPFSGNIQDPQSLHKYAYVHGNPILGTDPTGRSLVSVSLSVGLVSAGLTLGYNLAKGFAYGFEGNYSPGKIAIRTAAAFAAGFTISYALLWYTGLIVGAGHSSLFAGGIVSAITAPGIVVLAVHNASHAFRSGDEIDQYFAVLDLVTLFFGIRRLNKYYPRSVDPADPISFYGKSHNEIAESLKAAGFTEKPYGGTSTAYDFILDTKQGRWTVTANYGGGRHSPSGIYSSPYYYKVKGPDVTPTKVIDPTKYPQSEWGPEANTRVIDGRTGTTLKEKGETL